MNGRRDMDLGDFIAERRRGAERHRAFAAYVDECGGFGNADVDAAFDAVRAAFHDVDATMDTLIDLHYAAARRMRAFKAYPADVNWQAFQDAVADVKSADAAHGAAFTRYRQAMERMELAMNAAFAPMASLTRAERRRRRRNPTPRTTAMFGAIDYARDQKAFISMNYGGQPIGGG